MKFSKILAIALALVMVFALVACSSGAKTETETKTEEPAKAAVKVAMITDYGDITDQSFNQTTYEACKAFCEGKKLDFQRDRDARLRFRSRHQGHR